MISELTRLSIILVVSLSLFIAIRNPLALASASSSAGSGDAPKPRPGEDSSALQGINPDKFVSSAPLIVAAACREGVALIAMHRGDDELSLLLDDNDSTQYEGTDSTDAPKPRRMQDLPTSYRGPFRIYQIDSVGTTLVCAGWRTDGELLAKKCRNLAAAERDRFGTPIGSLNEYGQYLAAESSQWMAQCAVSDNVRALSCVGLLTSCGRSSDLSGRLWLVDATGYYRVRAHALGAGDEVINPRLRKLDFSTMTLEECLEKLVALLGEECDKEDTSFAIPPRTTLEAAVVESAQRKMKRIRQPFVTKSTTSTRS